MSENSTPWFVAIGASGSDGLRDLQILLAELPATGDAVFLVVLHRPWDEISYLREILSQRTCMPVVIAEQGQSLECNVVYIGRPEHHLKLIARCTGFLVGDPTREYRNRTVDLLFKSLAEYGSRHIIGVVLSGALDDGSRGLQRSTTRAVERWWLSRMPQGARACQQTPLRTTAPLT